MNQHSFSKTSEIIVAKFNSELKREIDNFYRDDEVVWFNYESLLVDSVREIIEESYRSSERNRRVIIETKKINHISQNAILKILEEPPKGLYFTIIVPSKSILLPTVRSRVSLQTINSRNENQISIQLPNLSKLDLQTLHLFLGSLQKIEKGDERGVLFQLFEENRQYRMKSEDFNRFEIASQLLSLGSNPKRVFLMVLLPFVNRNLKI